MTRYLLILILALLSLASSAQAIVICEATLNPPTLNEGMEVPCSMDLSGNTRITGSFSLSLATNAAVNATITSATPTVIATGSNTMGAVLQGTSPWVVSGSVSATVTSSSVVATISTLPSITVGTMPAISATITNTATSIETAQVATSYGTPFANASLTTVMADKFGRTVVVPQGDRALATFNTVATSAAAEMILASAAGTASYWDLTMLGCSNAANGNGTRVDIRGTTGGKILFSHHLGTGQNFTLTFFVPFPQPTVNSTWTFQLATASAVQCNVGMILNK